MGVETILEDLMDSEADELEKFQIQQLIRM